MIYVHILSLQGVFSVVCSVRGHGEDCVEVRASRGGREETPQSTPQL